MSVAVRFDLLTDPDENVKVALPVDPVVTVCPPRIPVSAPKVTSTFGTAAFEALSAETVTVVVVELSDLTVVGVAESCRVASAVEVTVPDPPDPVLPVLVPLPVSEPNGLFPVALPPSPPPPQPTSATAPQSARTRIADLITTFI